jgi:hypothetical protein
MDINEPSPLDVALATVNSTQGPVLEVAYSLSLGGSHLKLMSVLVRASWC